MELGSRERAPDEGQAGRVGGVPERFVPREMSGELVAAEHLARYRWVAQAAKGKRVLDAACGTGYGCAILAAAGAKEVVGVDNAEEAVAAARESATSARIELADVLELPFEDDSFDLIVSFETIEHLAESDGLLDEFSRVLAPGGLVAISSPNREVSAGGNPHHVRELLPVELRDALSSRFGKVRLLRQHGWYATAVLGDAAFVTEDEDVGDVAVRKVGQAIPGEETYTVGLASDAELPELRQVVALSEGLDQRRLVEAWRTATAELSALQARIESLEEVEEDRDRLREELASAEQAAAQVLELRAREEELARIRSSLAWRITAPLRILEARAEYAAPRLIIRLRRFVKRLMVRLRS